MRSDDTDDPVLSSMLAKTEHVEFEDYDFKRSSYSKPEHDCVEIAIKDGVIAVRDSKHADTPVLKFVKSEWDYFIQGAKDGEFDVE